MSSVRVSFTLPELAELRRALALISEEDNGADVNMEPEAVQAKASAGAKLAHAQTLLAARRRRLSGSGA
jgi:hypothetical protein